MYKLKDIPRRGSLVLCTVQEISDSFVKVELDEYEEIYGVIPIDEVSHKRIRSLRKFVDVGKKLVCKVLDVDESNKIVTLSLKRVSEGEKMLKLSEYKKEKQAYNLLKQFSNKYNIPIDEIESKIINKIIGKGYRLYQVFEKVSIDGENALKEFKINKNLVKKLVEFIKENVKPRIFRKKFIFKIQSLAPDGVKKIKNTLLQLEEKYGAKIAYLSALNYEVLLEDLNPKNLEKRTNNMLNEFESLAEKEDLIYEIEEKKE